MTKLAFVDIESTGLNPEIAEIWEVGLVLRDKNPLKAFGGEFAVHTVEAEHHWFLPVQLGTADPKALDVGHYYERHPHGGKTDQDNTDLISNWAFAREFSLLTRGATLVGANVRFDEAFLQKHLRDNMACPGWNFRLCDVEAMVQGYMGLIEPLGLAKSANVMEVKNEYEAHTALDDAKLARDVYDAVLKGKR